MGLEWLSTSDVVALSNMQSRVLLISCCNADVDERVDCFLVGYESW